jgi:hypothetical protein
MPMSPSGDLQDIIYRRLTSDPSITWSVFDRADPQQPMPFIEFGPEDVQEDDDECITGTNHQFQVDLFHSEAGMFQLKEMMGAVKRSLHNFDGELTDNALHSIRFVRMTVLQEPDGVNYHGVVQFEAMIESDIS